MLNSFENKGEMKKEDKRNERVTVTAIRSPARGTPQPVRFFHPNSLGGVSTSPQRVASPAITSDDSLIAKSPAKAEDVMDLVAEGELEQLKIFLQSVGTENIVNYIETEKFGRANESLLHIAVKFNKFKIVRYFRELGVSLELYNDLQQTPFHIAAKFCGNRETITELFQFENAFSLFDQKDKSGNSARFYAKWYGREEIFSYIERSMIFAKVEKDSGSEKFNEAFYNSFYDEEGPLLFAVQKAKKEYKAEEQYKQQQKEQIENLAGVVSSKSSPYVLGRS